MNKISVKISDGFLVAEKSLDPDFNEIYIYLTDEAGFATQDLAIVGQNYGIGSENRPFQLDNFSVKVYGDKDSEDYTDEFTIERWKGECDE